MQNEIISMKGLIQNLPYHSLVIISQKNLRQDWKKSHKIRLLSDSIPWLELNRFAVSVPPLGRGDSDVTLACPAGEGKKGGTAAQYIAESPGALGPLFPLSFVECPPQSHSGQETWLDIWKSSALFRGLPLPFPETPRCLRRLQAARLKETVSGER